MRRRTDRRGLTGIIRLAWALNTLLVVLAGLVLYIAVELARFKKWVEQMSILTDTEDSYAGVAGSFRKRNVRIFSIDAAF